MFSLARGVYQIHGLRNAKTLNLVRAVSMKIVPVPPEPTETHDERNKRLNRAMSPHLTIYKPQLTSMLSISHRFAGMALAGYVAAFGITALISPVDFSNYITMIEGLNLSSGTLTTIKFILAYPLTFHTINGVRHLIWDSGKCLSINQVYTTGYVTLATSLIAAVGLALM